MKEKKDDENELFIPKTKYKGLKIFIVILLIGGLILGGYYFYQSKFNNPQNIVNEILSDAKADIEKKLVTDIGNDIYKVNGYVKVEANISNEEEAFEDILKDIELQFSGEVDLNNSIGNIDINTKYKNNKLINIKTYFEKNDTYLLLDGIYDKYIKVNTGEGQNNAASLLPKLDIKPEEIQTLCNALIDSLKEEINKLDINKTDATITVNNKEMNVINNYVELKNKEVNNFIKNIINSLKSDNNFSKALKKVTDKDIKDVLNEIISDIDDESFNGIYKINFYTDKSLFNKKIISVRQSISQGDTNLSINVDKISDDEYEFSLSTMGMTYSIKVKKSNSVFNIIMKEDFMGMYLQAELNMNYEKIDEVTKPDISNSKDIKELTEKENKEIEENLSKNKNLEKIFNELTKEKNNEE